jgi:DNA-binding MarR family transcriptional regulator
MIFHLLMHNVKILKDILSEEFGKEGLHHGQARALAVLKKYGELPQINLAKGLNIKRSTVTRMLKQMEVKGMISRDADKNDNRIIRVKLTAKGELLAGKVESVWNRIEQSFKESMNESEYKSIEHGLENILKCLGGKRSIFKENIEAVKDNNE